MKFLSILAIAISIVSANMNTNLFKPYLQLNGNLSIDNMRKQNIEIVKKAVEGLNQNLPVDVDSITKLIKVEGKDNRLIYIFKISTPPTTKEELIKKGKTEVAPRVKKRLCTSASRFLQADIDITYIYINSATNDKILQVDVTKKDCPNLR